MLARHRWALVVGVIVVVGGSVLRYAVAEDAAAPMTYGRYVQSFSGELAGTVIYPDGKTPVADAAVRVWSVEAKKFVAEVLTDKKGRYEVTKLKDGRYFVVYGDRVTVDLRVDRKAQTGTKTLNVIVPRGTTIFAQMAQERRAAILTLMGAGEDEPPAGGAGGVAGDLLKGMIIGAGGTATAVAIYEVVDNSHGDDDDDDKKVVSP